MAVTAVIDAVERIDVTEVLDAASAGNDLVVTPHPLTDAGRVVLRGVMLAKGDTLASLLARHGVQAGDVGWVVRVGGMEVPAALWARTRAKPGMLIEAHRVAGKNVLRLVAIVVLAYYTMGAGFGAGGLGGQMGISNPFLQYMVNVGAFMLGSMVINKLLPPPGAGGYGGGERGSTYSLQGARNRARHFEPLGLLMGQVRVAPDFAAQPYSWFEGDDQMQYVQLHAGLNVHTVDELKIGQTDIGTYTGVTVTRSGFATGNGALLQWESVDTVAGGLLDAETAPGAYVERNSSPNTWRLQVDLVGQLQYINSKGNPQRFTCNIELEYRLLPAGGWQPFVGSSSVVELANSTTKPLRRTIARDVPAGQYAVRARKLTANEKRQQAANVVEWAALKSFQADTGAAVARQVVGIKIKASGQLNGVLDQVTWLATSTPCPVWNGSAWVTQATSNPGALYLQFCRGAFDASGRLLWGMGKPDDQIDIAGLQAWMLHCTAQGYRFDHWWDAAVSRADVLDAIAAAGLAARSYHTGKLGVVYMASGQAIEAVIGMGNIKRGSMRVDYATRTTADELEVASPDRDNGWLPASLRVLAPGVTTPRETARMSPPGVTTQAGRLLSARAAMAQNIYGRKSVSWEMDLEHLTVRRWSLVAMSHDLTQWGHSGRLKAAVNAAGTVTVELDAEVPAGSAMHVGLRLPGEQAYRVFSVAAFTGTAHTLTLAEAWPAGVALPGSSADNPAHDTLWIFDFKAQPGLRLRVVDIKPTANLAGARISAVPEPDEFWAYMASGAYTVPAVATTRAPVVLSNLRVTQDRLTLSYDLTAELSIAFDATGPYDHAQVWGAVGDDTLQLLGTTRTTRFAGWRVVNAGEVSVRVQAFDALGRPGAVLTGTHDVALDSPLRVQGNLLPVGELVAGLGASTGGATMVGHWSHLATADAPVGPICDLAVEAGPDGLPAVVWRATPGTGGLQQGGFARTPGDLVDAGRAYRFGVWIHAQGAGGLVFFGCSGVQALVGGTLSSSWFGAVDRGTVVAGRWYLAVGYVYPSTYAGTASLSGLWDGVTGQKVADWQDFRWAADNTTCEWSTLWYGPAATDATQRWAQPMVHVVDGTEPSIAALLAMSTRGRVAWMTASSQVFGIAKSGAVSPASITLTALAQNLGGAPTFTVTAGAATLAGSGTTRTLAYADMAADSVTVVMAWGGIEDAVTIVKLREGLDGSSGDAGVDGEDAIVGLLTNESHVVSTAADGSGGSFAAAGGTFQVFVGLVDRTGAGSVAYSVASSSGVTISIASTGVYTVSGMSADVGTATLRAVYGSVTIDKVYSIARSKAGADGADGNDGADGQAVNLIFRRSSTQPLTPADSAGVPSGWYDVVSSVPAGVGPIWSAVGRLASSTASWVWQAPVQMQGVDGAFSGVMPATPPVRFSGSVISAVSSSIEQGFSLYADGSAEYVNGSIIRNFRWHSAGAPAATYYVVLNMVEGPAPYTGTAGSAVPLTSDVSWTWLQSGVGSIDISGYYLILDGSGSGANVVGGGDFHGHLAVIGSA